MLFETPSAEGCPVSKKLHISSVNKLFLKMEDFSSFIVIRPLIYIIRMKKTKVKSQLISSLALQDMS